MEKSTVYIETSVISYLAARPSPDLMTAACQQVTAEWWEQQREKYSLLTSALVVAECEKGDLRTGKRRVELLRDIAVLKITDDVRELARALIREDALPAKAEADALHIAAAAVHKVDYLLTWNCRHIDNPALKPLVRKVCTLHGHVCPEICTPFEIVELDTYGK